MSYDITTVQMARFIQFFRHYLEKCRDHEILALMQILQLHRPIPLLIKSGRPSIQVNLEIFRSRLKRRFAFAQFGEGLFDEVGVFAVGFEIFVGGGPEFFGFAIALQVPQGQAFVPIDAGLIG